MLFGVIGYFHYVQEIVQKDPIEWLTELDKKLQSKEQSIQMTLMTEDAPIMVYAGVNSWQDMIGKPNVSFDYIKKCCNALTPAQVGDIMRVAINSFTPDTTDAGEPKGQEVRAGA